MASDHRSGTHPSHRIRKAIFELQFPDEPAAFRARSVLAAKFEQVFIPILGAVCDAYAPNGRIVQLDRMEVDLGRIDPEWLDEASLRQAILTALESSARPRSARADSSGPTSDLGLAQTWIAFLERGRWPWYSPFSRVAELEAELLALQPAEAGRVAQETVPLLQRRDVRLRVAYQLSLRLLQWLMEHLQPGHSDEILETTHRLLGGPGSDESRAIALAVAVALSSDDKGAPRGGTPHSTLVVEDLVREEAQQLGWTPVDGGEAAPSDQDAPLRRSTGIRVPTVVEVDSPSSAQTDGAVDEEASLYVRCAGIVLLHPFLEHFFQQVGISDEISDWDHVRRERAAHLLYHLATGQERPEEHETPLLKVLCGWPLDYPLAKELTFSQQERQEADSLLRAAIDHWGQLKNTSPDGLREAFLQRNGRLARLESPSPSPGRHLTVEQRGVDVLLGSLPWGLSVVRLPWMDTPLWVDWA